VGEDPVEAGAVAAADVRARVLIGPVRSREVVETLEATAPAGLPLIAPMATWAGVTRDDEPGCDDHPADHRGTVFRMLARDTVVAACIAEHVGGRAARALVVAGEHEYGVQLDGQLQLAGLPRVENPDDADIVVVCGLAGQPEIEEARLLAPLPVIAFDGVQGADLGAGREVQMAMPFAPAEELPTVELFAGVGQARRAAELAVEVHRAGVENRESSLAALRALGGFDEHGDPSKPEVWLWRVANGWTLTPEHPLRSTV
jgi:hypothetical protein